MSSSIKLQRIETYISMLDYDVEKTCTLTCRVTGGPTCGIPEDTDTTSYVAGVPEGSDVTLADELSTGWKTHGSQDRILTVTVAAQLVSAQELGRVKRRKAPGIRMFIPWNKEGAV